jgi:hypothetical protein
VPSGRLINLPVTDVLFLATKPDLAHIFTLILFQTTFIQLTEQFNSGYWKIIYQICSIKIHTGAGSKPYTNKVVNIEPFFRVIEFNFVGSFINAAEKMNEIIRKISCFPYNEPNGINTDENNSSMLWQLYSFQDLVFNIVSLQMKTDESLIVILDISFR